MNKTHFLFFFLHMSLSAFAYVETVPLLAIACSHSYYPNRSNGYDCARAYSARRTEVNIPNTLSDRERTILINQAMRRIAWQAEAECPSCRFFGGATSGCIAVAERPFFTGVGSFLGSETNQSEAEFTALRDCANQVGTVPESCRIVVSECTKGID